MPEDRQGTARAEIERYLQRQDDKGLLRLITCGSVDDGKSTLLGRLLYDSQLLFEDQLSSLAQDSQRFGTTGSGELDLALLVDGLAAEREQGITIDVAQSRHYPYSDIAAHVIGYVAAVSEKELTGDPVLELPGFRIGKNGIERIIELDLNDDEKALLATSERAVRDVKHVLDGLSL